jgi:hypothetical protein
LSFAHAGNTPRSDVAIVARRSHTIMAGVG